LLRLRRRHNAQNDGQTDDIIMAWPIILRSVKSAKIGPYLREKKYNWYIFMTRGSVTVYRTERLAEVAVP